METSICISEFGRTFGTIAISISPQILLVVHLRARTLKNEARAPRTLATRDFGSCACRLYYVAALEQYHSSIESTCTSIEHLPPITIVRSRSLLQSAQSKEQIARMARDQRQDTQIGDPDCGKRKRNPPAGAGGGAIRPAPSCKTPNVTHLHTFFTRLFTLYQLASRQRRVQRKRHAEYSVSSSAMRWVPNGRRPP